jgi:hypothetical protein
MIKEYVVTGFDENYWYFWGSSWLASLREFSKQSPEQIIVVGFNLSENTKSKINDTGVSLFSGIYSGNIRYDTIQFITDLAKKENAIFAYWDADVFFQDDISEIFKIANNDLVVCSNLNQGFLAGPSHRWMFMSDILNIMSFFNDKSDPCNFLIKYHDDFITKIDNTWNFTDIPHLKDVDNKLSYKNQLQKVIHPTGQIKIAVKNKNILFFERHKDLHQTINRKKVGYHKLINKK